MILIRKSNKSVNVSTSDNKISTELKPFGVALDSYNAQIRHSTLLAKAMSEFYSGSFQEESPAQKREKRDNLIELLDYHISIVDFIKSNYALPLVEDNKTLWVGPTKNVIVNEKKGEQLCYIGLENKTYPDDLLPLPVNGWNNYIEHMQLIVEKNLFL
ncbi:MAG TPA: hypothetical protein P5277_01680 [Candidatus Paceibacterota bacterium]|nr:hypothetical protein [Candidatus Paceibacterota bacterium]